MYTAGVIYVTAKTLDSVTTTSPATTTTATRGRRLKAMLPLICTFGRLLGQPATLPEEGLCDYAFYEFHYQPHGSPSVLLLDQPLLRWYMEATRARTRTQYGLGFVPFDMSDLLYQLSLTSKAAPVFKTFWEARIYHYGILTVAHVTTADDSRLILQTLQTLKTLAAQNGRSNQRTLTVLGLTAFSEEVVSQAAAMMRDDQQPDIIIVYGHLIFERKQYSHCKILAPTNLHLGGSPPSYAYDLIHAYRIASWLKEKNIKSALYVSVSLRGLRYEPATLRDTAMRPFAACKDFAGKDMLEKSVSYEYLCNEKLRRGAVHVDKDEQVTYVIDAQSSSVITYDDEDTLRYKLCSLKGNYTHLDYGIAVYDVDHDDYANNCFGKSRYGSYSRLKMAAKINEFFRQYYTVQDEANCHKTQ